MTQRSSFLHLLGRGRARLSERLAVPIQGDGDGSFSSRRHCSLIAVWLAVFVVALGVRLFHWQEYRVEVERAGGDPFFQGISDHYERQAQRMLDGGGILFPKDSPVSGDATIIIHPPGYSILMAGIFEVFGNSDGVMRLAQMICDALAVVVVLLIGAELLPVTAAVIAGMLVAFSPHLAYYSMRLSPDSIAVLPILIAIYLIIKANKRPRIVTIIAAGAFIGLSCWLRSNGLLLAPFLAVAIATFFERGKRLRYSTAFICAALVFIAPITVRNLVVFGHFIPLSLGAGITLIEGIGDYDDEGKFGLPKTDKDVQRMEAELYGRPEYAVNLEAPDGIERDSARFARGLTVLHSNPGWFLGVMIHRAGFMLRYNDSGRHDWPFGTASAPILSREATFSHDFEISDKQPMWSSLPGDLMAGAAFKSPLAEFSIADDGSALRLKGDSSDFGDQLASASIAVQKNTDYLLILPIKLEEGHLAAKVTTPDFRIALASLTIPDADVEEKKWQKRKAKQGGEAVVDSTEQRPMSIVKLPFASGNRTEVRLVISNNGQSPVRPLAQVGRAELFAMGPTPFLWTRYPRAIIRGIQRNLYTTGRMIPLVIIGVVLLAISRRWRALAILVAVPLYYLCTQSALHTEYRYILAIHYFLFVIASVTIGCLLTLVMRLARRLPLPFRDAS